jgi:hypothetical protein
MAVQATYDAAMQDHLPNRFEVGFLAARKFGDFPNTLNIGLENEYGTNARDGTRFNVNYRVQYAYSDSLVPGLEFYKGKGRLGTEPNGPKEVQLGPTLSGNLTENAKYDLGILWGLSNASPDNRFKWIVTYSF